MQYTLKAARQAAHKTQAQMAELLGMPRTTYQYLERYPERTTIQQARIISTVTGIDIDALDFFAPEST